MSVMVERDVLKEFQRSTWRSPVQLATTVIGLAAGWILTDRALAVSWALGTVASLVIAIFTVRAFIIFHDCGHGSFTRSRRLNTVVGSVIGVVVFTPYTYWTRAHIRHHATTGDLDRRGSGDLWLMTTDEYRVASPGQRLYYRIYHHPLFLMTVGPVIKFVIAQRLRMDPRIDRPAAQDIGLPDKSGDRLLRRAHGGLDGPVQVYSCPAHGPDFRGDSRPFTFSTCSIFSLGPTGDGTPTGTTWKRR